MVKLPRQPVGWCLGAGLGVCLSLSACDSTQEISPPSDRPRQMPEPTVSGLQHSQLVCTLNESYTRATDGWRAIKEAERQQAGRAVASGRAEIEYAPASLICTYWADGKPAIDVPAGLLYVKTKRRP